MKRKSIFELLNNNENINFEKEIENIRELFCDYSINNCKYSLKTVLDRYFIKEWKYRKRCISVYDLCEKLEITEAHLERYNYDLEHSLRYMELIYNLTMLVVNYIDTNNQSRILRNYSILTTSAIFNNIRSVLEEINYEILKVEDRYEIVEKNMQATSVAENNPCVANEVIEYRKYDLKGDLESKKQILFKLSNEIEPLKSKFKGTNYNALMEDTQFMLNTFNIRHNNIAGRNKKEIISNMSEEELEKWYDKTYINILGIYTINDYLVNKKELEEIKKVK